MVDLLAPTNCELHARARFCQCPSRQGEQPVRPFLQLALPVAGNVPWPHCLWSGPRFSIWRAAFASLVRGIYCLTLSRNCRIGSNAYSINVRPPTMLFASPFIPTRRGKTCPGRGEITERSSEPSATKCEPSLAVIAEGLIQSSFPVTAP